MRIFYPIFWKLGNFNCIKSVFVIFRAEYLLVMKKGENNASAYALAEYIKNIFGVLWDWPNRRYRVLGEASKV